MLMDPAGYKFGQRMVEKTYIGFKMKGLSAEKA